MRPPPPAVFDETLEVAATLRVVAAVSAELPPEHPQPAVPMAIGHHPRMRLQQDVGPLPAAPPYEMSSVPVLVASQTPPECGTPPSRR